ILATCIQHEMDHLEGLLFVDHISALKRNMILRRLSKQKKADKSDVWVPKLRTANAVVAEEEESARAL
ncbi:MAG: peptide deformylase, partial [Kiloniellales bacterium]|nr:peptide deformylase [Kiloniellales bacterium]